MLHTFANAIPLFQMSSPSTVPIYYLTDPCHSSRHHSNVTYTMESSLTGRMSGSLCELSGTPYLTCVILHFA